MALFSRRPKRPISTEQTSDVPAETPAAESTVTDAVAEDTAVSAPQVGISVSSYGGLGAPSAPVAPEPASGPPAEAAEAPRGPIGSYRGQAEAPEPTEVVAGLPDNVLLQTAVAEYLADSTPTRLMHVGRQLLQGQVYLRVQGDARALLGEGQPLPFAVATRGDLQYVVVFSGGAALSAAVQADGNSATSAIGQAVPIVLKHVLDGTYGGIVIDHVPGKTSPVLPRAILERAVAEGDPDRTVKTLLTAPRDAATAAAVASALVRVPLWIGANRASETDPWGVAESRTSDGRRYLEVFTHPLESVALGRGDRPMPITAQQLGRALTGDAGLTGIVVDPAGPWIELTRDDLGELVAAATASAPVPGADAAPSE